MSTSEFIQTNLGDISLYRLSLNTGISITNLQRYIRGEQEPTIPKLKLIIKALDIHRDEIVGFLKA